VFPGAFSNEMLKCLAEVRPCLNFWSNNRGDRLHVLSFRGSEEPADIQPEPLPLIGPHEEIGVLRCVSGNPFVATIRGMCVEDLLQVRGLHTIGRHKDDLVTHLSNN
jgi:hypothetical protein